MQYIKLSTSRDFRINAATLDAALQEQDNSEEASSISYCNWQRNPVNEADTDDR